MDFKNARQLLCVIVVAYLAVRVTSSGAQALFEDIQRLKKEYNEFIDEINKRDHYNQNMKRYRSSPPNNDKQTDNDNWVPFGSDSNWVPFGDDKNWVPYGADSDWTPHGLKDAGYVHDNGDSLFTLDDVVPPLDSWSWFSILGSVDPVIGKDESLSFGRKEEQRRKRSIRRRVREQIVPKQ